MSNGFSICGPYFFYHHYRLLGAACGKNARLKSVGSAAVIWLKRSWNIAHTTGKPATSGIVPISGQASID